jgi:TorA maturation chaperone TorD
VSSDFERELSVVASVFGTGDVQEGLGFIARFISSFRHQPEEEILRRIAVDRTRLFRGIREKDSPPPPYESVYREQRLRGESSSEVYGFYCTLGVSLPEDWKESSRLPWNGD